jgi:hypothetical protein
VTLDLPTSVPGKDDSGAKAFYDQVIWPIVDLQRSPKDNLYSWLEVMFAFCSGKPFAYCSRYVPSPRIHAIASRHRVTLRHFPLRLLPTRLVERNRTFRFMSLTREQWEEFRGMGPGRTWPVQQRRYLRPTDRRGWRRAGGTLCRCRSFRLACKTEPSFPRTA